MWKEAILCILCFYHVHNTVGERYEHAFERVSKLDNYYTYYPNKRLGKACHLKCAMFCSRDSRCRMFTLRQGNCHVYYYYQYILFYGMSFAGTVSFMKKGRCVDGYRIVDKTCMKWMSSPQTLQDAYKTCLNENASVVEVQSTIKAEYIKRYIKDIGMLPAFYWAHCEFVTNLCHLKLREDISVLRKAAIDLCTGFDEETSDPLPVWKSVKKIKKTYGTEFCLAVDTSQTKSCLRWETCNATSSFICESTPIV